MGLAAELLEDWTEAFDGELADAVTALTFNRYTNVYSTASGINVPTLDETENIRGVARAFTNREIEKSNGSIQVGDLKLLAIVSEVIVLTGGIKVDDQVIGGPEGLDYRVKAIRKDATGTMYVGHLRVYDG